MSVSNKQTGKTALDREVASLGVADDSQWGDPEKQQSPALGKFELLEDFRLHQFGEYAENLAEAKDSFDDKDGSVQEPQLPALDASNDNSFLEKEVDPQLLAVSQRLADRRLLLGGLVCSLVLHILLGAVLITFKPQEHVTTLPVHIEVRLLPENPLMRSVEELEVAPIEEVAEIEEIAELEQIEEAPIEEIVEQVEAVVEQALPTELIAETEATAEIVEMTEPGLPLPLSSFDVIQSAIQQDFTEQQIEDRSWASTCTTLQRQSGVIGCASQEEPNFEVIEQSPESLAIYEFHNPPVERSRTERSLNTIATNSAQLAANLASADIPQGLGEFMMTEMESTITLYSEQGNRVLDHMDRMVDQSDAALMIRALNDPWVRLQRQNQQQSRYYSRQDLQRIGECGSPKVFVVAVTELEKFADCLTREGNLPMRLLLIYFDLGF